MAPGPCRHDFNVFHSCLWIAPIKIWPPSKPLGMKCPTVPNVVQLWIWICFTDCHEFPSLISMAIRHNIPVYEIL